MTGGNEGSLAQTQLQVTHVNHYQGDYGARTFINFRSEVDGVRYLWRASREVPVEPGQRYVVSGHIRSTDQTGQIELTRCRIESVHPPLGDQTSVAQPRTSGGRIPAESRLGRVIMASDSGGSWLSTIVLFGLSLLTLLPLVGLLVSVILLPVLVVLAIVLAVRLAARRGRAVAGTHIVKRNLSATLICMLLVLVGGGYQVSIVLGQVLTNT